MKTILIRGLLTAMLVLSPALAPAQMASGSYDVDFTGDLNLFDLSGTYTEDLGGIGLDYTLNMEPSGKFTGTGGATVGDFMGYDMNLNIGMTFSGSVSSSRNVTRVTMQAKLNGSGTVMGYNVTFSGNLKETCEVDLDTRALAGNVSGRVSVAVPEMHKKASQAVREPVSTSLPADVDGTWHLSMDVSPATGTKYAGSAEAVLPNGRTLPFTVTGSYSSKADTSKLTLKGSGLNRGASLSVLAALDEGGIVNLRTLSGKVLGQALKYKVGQ